MRGCTSLVAGVLLVSVFGAGCAPSDDSEYAQTVLPIIEANCTKCHLGNKSRGGLSLVSHDSVMAGGDSGKVVVAGDDASSLLYGKVTHEDAQKRMPKGGESLSAEDIETIRAWIDEGAK